MVVVLSEAPLPSQGISSNAQELAHITEAARLLGARVITIPTDFAVSGIAENALAHVGEFIPRVTGICVGYIPQQIG